MKYLILISILFSFLVGCGQAGEAPVDVPDYKFTNEEADEVDSDQHVLSPEQEEEYFTTHFPGVEKARAFKFAQTTWEECVDAIKTGNYFGAACSNRRGIAQILETFMDRYMYQCINAGLAAQGGGQVADLHIVHAGIFGDPRHSPRSMHAENRAIDIKSFEIKLTDGSVRKVVYEGTANRAFYTAFRNCWGKVVSVNNNCPLYKDSTLLTASIGWEDKNHQKHMHTSVPYCVGGNYGPYYFKK